MPRLAELRIHHVTSALFGCFELFTTWRWDLYDVETASAPNPTLTQGQHVMLKLRGAFDCCLSDCYLPLLNSVADCFLSLCWMIGLSSEQQLPHNRCVLSTSVPCKACILGDGQQCQHAGHALQLQCI